MAAAALNAACRVPRADYHQPGDCHFDELVRADRPSSSRSSPSTPFFVGVLMGVPEVNTFNVAAG